MHLCSAQIRSDERADMSIDIAIRKARRNVCLGTTNERAGSCCRGDEDEASSPPSLSVSNESRRSGSSDGVDK